MDFKHLTWAFLFSAAALTQQSSLYALTVFSDGGTHTINDGTFRTEEIQVSDSPSGQPTTLVFEAGAIYDSDGSVLTVNGHSRILVNGGQFGGGGHTAQLYAYGNSTFEVHGGSFGGRRLGSGVLSAFDNSHVKIYGGSFGLSGNISGAISASNNARIDIYGGSFGGTGGYSGAIFVTESAKLEIHGGLFQGTAPTGGKLFLSGSSATKVLGCHFAGYPNFGEVIATAGTLVGTLENGAAVTIPFQRVESASLLLVNTCDSDGDGIPDVIDSCSHSDNRATVFIGNTNTGVANKLISNGCTLADQIAELRSIAKNHGQFVSSVAELTNSLRKSNVITEAEKTALLKSAAQQKP